MTIRPIIFSGPMVRALLGGTKTQTRRVLKPQPEPWREFHLEGGCQRSDWTFQLGDYTDDGKKHRFGLWMHCAFHESRFQPLPYAVGDLLYVREAWARTSVAPIVETIDKPWIVYRECDNRTDYGGPWKPSIHLPRADSRITLKVTGVKVERVQDISPDDAWDEGVDRRSKQVRQMWLFGATAAEREAIYKRACVWEFERLWDSINADRGYGWEADPWVVAVSFEVIKANVDSLSNPGPGD